MQAGASTPHAPSSKPTYVCLDTPLLLLHTVGGGVQANPFHAITADTVIARARRPDSLRFHAPVPSCVTETRHGQQRAAPPPSLKRTRDDDGEADGVVAPVCAQRDPEVIVRELDEVELLAPFSPVVAQRWRESLDARAHPKTVNDAGAPKQESSGRAAGEKRRVDLASAENAGRRDPLRAPWLHVESATHVAADCGRRDVSQQEEPSYAPNTAMTSRATAGEASSPSDVVALDATSAEAATVMMADEEKQTIEDKEGVACVRAPIADACGDCQVHVHSSVLQRLLLQALLILQQPRRSRSARFFLRSGFGFHSTGPSNNEDARGAHYDPSFALSVLPSAAEESMPSGPDHAHTCAIFSYRFGDCQQPLDHRRTLLLRLRREAALVQPAACWQCRRELEGFDAASSCGSEACTSWGVLALGDEAVPTAATTGNTATAPFRTNEVWSRAVRAALAPSPRKGEAAVDCLDDFLTYEMVPRIYTYVPPLVPRSEASATPTPSAIHGAHSASMTAIAAVYHRPLHSFLQKQSFVFLSFLAHLSWSRWVAQHLREVIGTAKRGSSPLCACHYRLCLPALSPGLSFGLARSAEWTSFLLLHMASSGSGVIAVRVDDCERTLTWRLSTEAAATQHSGSLRELLDAVGKAVTPKGGQ